MSEETSPQPSTKPEPGVDQSLSWLKGLVQSILLSLILLTCTVGIFIYRQASLAREQAKELELMVTDFKMNAQPVIDDLKSKLAPFAKTHPDFAPLYLRYFGTNNPEGGPKQ